MQLAKANYIWTIYQEQIGIKCSFLPWMRWLRKIRGQGQLIYLLICVIGNHNCRIFRNQEFKGFGNKEYIGFGNKGAKKMETRNTEICRINIFGNGTNPLYIKAYGLS